MKLIDSYVCSLKEKTRDFDDKCLQILSINQGRVLYKETL